MRRRIVVAVLLLVGLALLAPGRHAGANATSHGGFRTYTGETVPFAGFELNEGQGPRDAKFLLRTGSGTVSFGASSIEAAERTGTRTGAVRDVSVHHWQIPPALTTRPVIGVHLRLTRINYFLRRNPRQWHLDVPTYEDLLYRSVGSGLGLEVSHKANGFAYRWVGAALAVREVVKVGRESGQRPSSALLSSPGLHTFTFPSEPLRAASYRAVAGHIALGPHPRQADSLPPSLAHTKLIGGTQFDEDSSGGQGAQNAANGIANDASGNIYIAGYTDAADFPTLHTLQTSPALEDAFVTKLDASGNLVYSSYLGGAGNDTGLGIAVGADGSPVVVGQTNSTDFPLRNPLQAEQGGNCDPNIPSAGTLCMDAFATKLASRGDSLVYSTYLGGSNNDAANAVAVDGSGATFVTGATESTNFPLGNPIETFASGQLCVTETDTDLKSGLQVACDHAFVSKIATDGQLVYSTYLGGQGDDAGAGIAVHDGQAYVAGITTSENFPMHSAFQDSLKGTSNAFLSVLTATGSALVTSTYLGGTGRDDAAAVAVDDQGAVYLAGETASPDFPVTVNAAQGSKADLEGDYSDAFVTKLNPGETTLAYSTYLGGASDDSANGLALDVYGNAYVSGDTQSDDFPTVSGVQTINDQASDVVGAQIDGFLTKLNSEGTSFTYSTYIGEPTADKNSVSGVAVNGDGNAWVAGATDVNQPDPLISVLLEDVLQPLPATPTPTATATSVPTTAPPASPSSSTGKKHAKCKKGKKLVHGKCKKVKKKA